MPAWIRNKWTHTSFALQITLSFIFILVVPAFVALTVAYSVFQTNVNEKIMDFAAANLKQASQNAENTLKNYENSVLQLVYNDTFLDDVKAVTNFNFLAAYEARIHMLNSMRAFTRYWPDIRNIMVVTPEGYWMYDRAVESISERHLRNFPPEITGLDDENVNFVKWLPTRYLDTPAQEIYYVLTYRQKLIDVFTSKVYGTIMLSINNVFLRDICIRSMVSESPEENNLFIMAPDGTIVSHWDKSLSGRTVLEFMSRETLDTVLKSRDSGDFFQADIGGNKMLINTAPIVSTGWLMVNMVSRAYLNRESEAYRRFALILALGLFLLIVTAAFIISGTAERSVQKIISAMDEAKDSMFSVRIDVRDNNEFGQISEHFNYLMQTIDRLMGDLQKQMEMSRVAARKEREAEIRALEVQIKPHFLYNTLDSINWIAIENGQMEISDMLGRLAELFRYNTVNSNSMVTIREELRYLEEYLYIQKSRFGGSFTYLFDAGADAGPYYIHKMLFQPLIENSVIHGFAGKNYGGILRIGVMSHDASRLKFSIYDNGKGMPSGTAARLFCSSESFSGEGIGVSNVIARLDAYYGDNYQINVQSAPDEGLKLDIIIPKITAPEHSGNSGWLIPKTKRGKSGAAETRL